MKETIILLAPKCQVVGIHLENAMFASGRKTHGSPLMPGTGNIFLLPTDVL
jgi:hypothetical protein